MSDAPTDPADIIAAMEAQLAADDTRRTTGGMEVHGDFNGYVLAVGGIAKGEFTMDLPNNKVTFHWEDSASAWPSTFVLTPPGGHKVPSTSHSETFEHQSFTGSANSHDVSGCQYELRYGTSTYGWMHYHGKGTTWYALPSKLTSSGLINAPELEFVPNTATGSVTTVKLYDSSL